MSAMSPPPLVGIPCTSRTDVEKVLAADEFQSVAARESMRSAGLAGARIEMYVAHDREHLGVGQLAVFRATRVG